MGQDRDKPYATCRCSDDVCQCAIELLRDEAMQALFIASQEDANDGRLRFIPRESIIDEITPEFVIKVIAKVVDTEDIHKSGFLDEAVNRICPRFSCYHCKNPFCTGKRVVFASLLFTGLQHLLGQLFCAAGPESCDGSLWKLSRGMVYGDEDPIFQRILQLHGPQKDLFFHWQYQLRPLCFPKQEIGSRIKKLGLEDGLEDNVRLPWTLKQTDATRLSSRELTQGSGMPQIIGLQSAKVEKIYIHRSHHSLDESTNCFALKTFLDDFDPIFMKENFKQELETNEVVPHSDRILPLLAAFEHRGNFCLLFPWADLGDLRHMWKTLSPLHDGASGTHAYHAAWYSSQWLIGECFGIASAVADIHGRGESTSSPYCLLHADIKPDNILGFNSFESVSLKLADFGHSHVLETTTSHVSVRSMVKSRSYRAPEYDILERATTKYDVWSLGCLFLDFVTWALLGWEGVETFREQRLLEENDPKANYGNVSEDTFFKRVAGRRSLRFWSKFGYSYKPTTQRRGPKSSITRQHNFSLQGSDRPVVIQVREPVTAHIDMLRGLHQVDDTIRQLLHVIETRMLVSDCDERAWSDEVRDKLSDILRRRLGGDVTSLMQTD